jgi:DNA-binding GntR family transcriptional regulator
MLERSQSAVDQVIAAVKSAIREARFAPGQRLVETDLMEQLGVSRGPVREALRRLAAEGLVQAERFRGASVLRMSRQQVIELNEIRGALEGFGASLAAVRLDGKGRERLMRLQRQSRSATGSSSYGDYNSAFHRLIWDLSGNRELPESVEHTRLSIFRLQFHSVLLSAAHIARSRADHARIAEAILAGDGGAAEKAMRLHIDNSTQGILQAPPYFFAS